MNEQVVDGSTGEVVGNLGQMVRLPTAGEQSPNLLKILEERAKLIERILDYAIGATHPQQWCDFAGKPWPTGPACESMARRCGVSITNVRSTKRSSSDDKGDFYLYVCEATVQLPSGFDSIEAFGTCSSRDTFLGTETSAGRKVSEIDEGNIMKAAYTNMIVNGVTRLLGVRNLSWDRLAALGLDKSKMGSVQFASGSRGGGQQASGSDLEFKFGRCKGKKVGEVDDSDLHYYLGIFEKDLADPEKAKYKANTEKQIAAVKAEQAKRANAKAGTEAKTNGTQPSVWSRISQILSSLGMPTDKHGEFARGVTKKTQPSELDEADVAAVHDAAQLWKQQNAQASGEKW